MAWTRELRDLERVPYAVPRGRPSSLTLLNSDHLALDVLLFLLSSALTAGKAGDHLDLEHLTSRNYEVP